MNMQIPADPRHADVLPLCVLQKYQ